MDDVKLANWFAGRDRSLVEVYRVFDSALTRALGVENGAVVWLTDYTLNKTGIGHKEIDFRDYKRLPEILSSGYVLPGNKKHSVLVIHADLSGEHFAFWSVGLKGTASREVFVTMFHKSHLKNARRLYRRSYRTGTLLRDHKEALVRRLLGYTSADA